MDLYTPLPRPHSLESCPEASDLRLLNSPFQCVLLHSITRKWGQTIRDVSIGLTPTCACIETGTKCNDKCCATNEGREVDVDSEEPCLLLVFLLQKTRAAQPACVEQADCCSGSTTTCCFYQSSSAKAGSKSRFKDYQKRGCGGRKKQRLQVERAQTHVPNIQHQHQSQF